MLFSDKCVTRHCCPQKLWQLVSEVKGSFAICCLNPLSGGEPLNPRFCGFIPEVTVVISGQHNTLDSLKVQHTYNFTAVALIYIIMMCTSHYFISLETAVLLSFKEFFLFAKASTVTSYLLCSIWCCVASLNFFLEHFSFQLRIFYRLTTAMDTFHLSALFQCNFNELHRYFQLPASPTCFPCLSSSLRQMGKRRI